MSWSCGLQFRVRTGPDRGVTYPIDSPVVKIGRARMPGDRQVGWLKVADDTVSRLHCELFWQEDRRSFRMIHRSTTNSTYINGEIVEDAELFDGDIMEIGSISLELQKADLRWTQAEEKSKGEQDWPLRDHEGPAIPTDPKAKELLKIPGATVAPVSSSTAVKIAIGPKDPYQFVTHEGKLFPLKENRVRLGSAVDPELEAEKAREALEAQEPQDPDKPKEPKRKRPHFDVHYVFDQADYSYYNLILRYDELYQGYKAVRIGPKAQEISISRSQGGLVWRSWFPEGVEVELRPGDLLLFGNVELTYQKVEDSAGKAQ